MYFYLRIKLATPLSFICQLAETTRWDFFSSTNENMTIGHPKWPEA